MTKAIIPKNRKPLTLISTAIKKEAEFVGRTIKEELEEMVSPFESSISVLMSAKKEGEDYVIRIYGNPGDTATINLSGESISSHDLIRFLDAGTRVRYAHMPEDFGNETFSRSLSTREIDYDREGAYLDTSEPKDGIEAREWFRLLKEKHADDIIKRISRVARSIA